MNLNKIYKNEKSSSMFSNCQKKDKTNMCFLIKHIRLTTSNLPAPTLLTPQAIALYKYVILIEAGEPQSAHEPIARCPYSISRSFDCTGNNFVASTSEMRPQPGWPRLSIRFRQKPPHTFEGVVTIGRCANGRQWPEGRLNGGKKLR